MTEQQFLQACDGVLDAIEDGLDASGIDADTQRSGQLLQIDCADGATLVVSGNAPVRQIWLAAPSGGFHFRFEQDRWVDTRSGEEFWASLSKCLTEHGGTQIVLAGR
jgi:CyaY protein